ncbi:MAG: PilZ domain-containing protein [Spirochaetota bacterium]
MSIITSQQIARYYELFKNVDVTFTKGVIEATGLITRQIYLKCLGEQWPCVIYSCSMSEAKIIAGLTADSFEKIRKANNMVSLRFSFQQAGKIDPLAFFLTAKAIGFNPYNKDNTDLTFITLNYTQRPPDDLIEILGTLLEANVNSKKRKEERILLTSDAIRKLGIKAKEAQILIQGIPRKGILRDISFSGAKIIIIGVARFLVDKEATLKIELEEKNKIIVLNGKILRFEPVEGRKDLAALVVLFDEKSIPMEYKMIINEYLTQIRKSLDLQNPSTKDSSPA